MHLFSQTLRLGLLVAALLACATPLSAAHGTLTPDTADAPKPHPGVHVVILGDSNTSIGGDDCTRPRGWNTWFREYFAPATCRSYARSGATWSHTVRTKADELEVTGRLSDDNVVYNQVLRLHTAWTEGRQPAPDLILIMAGTNDAWFKSERPGAYLPTVADAFDVPADTLLARPAGSTLGLTECVRRACLMLHNDFPKALIVLMTPMQTAQAPDELIARTGDLIEGCGLRMGIPVVRMDKESVVRSAREARQTTYTYDGTHTSEAGARSNGLLLARRADALLEAGKQP